MQLVRLLQPSDARLFQRFASFVWKLEDKYICLYTAQAGELMSKAGVDYDQRLHLDALGLIQFVQVGFTMSDEVNATYGTHRHILEFPRNQSFSVCPLSDIDNELISLCQMVPDAEYYELWLGEFSQIGVRIISVATNEPPINK